ncbi:hypothetical protein FB451DRAFT_1305120 [Mycena latifolia]|nr:hypothetical protein FB451DRAFT_1305120 [Mycena latifolia]
MALTSQFGLFFPVVAFFPKFFKFWVGWTWRRLCSRAGCRAVRFPVVNFTGAACSTLFVQVLCAAGGFMYW